MAAEIYNWDVTTEEEPQTVGAQLLGLGDANGIFWMRDFGDGLGNETFVVVEQEVVSIFTGRIESDEAEGMAFTVSSDIKKLTPGERHQQFVFDTDDGVRMMVVKNLGLTGITPALN